MSKFYVGQRVRVVKVYRLPVMLGCTATIIGPLKERFLVTLNRRALTYLVEIDGHGTHSDEGMSWAATPEQLEPLDDDSRSLTTWDEVSRVIGWKPGARVGA